MQTQPWHTLPDSIKRQAAPDLVAGKTWIHWGKVVEVPCLQELCLWLPAKSVAERYSNADKLHAVRMALAARPASSNRQVARDTGTTHPFVAKVRRLYLS